MWQTEPWGRTRTLAGCSWPSRGCCGRSSALSGCPGSSSPETSGIRSLRSGPGLRGLREAEEGARLTTRRQRGCQVAEKETVEAVGRSWPDVGGV